MYEEDEIEEEEIEPIYLFLWETNKPVYDLYLILRNYLTEFLSVDSAILLKLIEAKGLDLEQTLTDIPYIHSGYVSIISPEIPENGRSNEEH
jgi:hypothetical protein